MQRARSWFAPTRRSVLAMASAIGLSLLAPVVSQAAEEAAAPKKVKILYLDQSMGFRHQPVTRKGDELASSEKAMIALGKENGVFEVEPTQDA